MIIVNWNEVSDDQLREWLHQGRSYGDIATMTGAPSRDAVAGKVKRMRGRMERAAKKAASGAEHDSPAPQRALPVEEVTTVIFEDEVIEGNFEVGPEPMYRAPVVSTAVTIFDLRATSCRFPLWNEQATPIEQKFYCGAPTAWAPYCNDHRVMCCASIRSAAR